MRGRGPFHTQAFVIALIDDLYKDRFFRSCVPFFYEEIQLQLSHSATASVRSWQVTANPGRKNNFRCRSVDREAVGILSLSSINVLIQKLAKTRFKHEGDQDMRNDVIEKFDFGIYRKKRLNQMSNHSQRLILSVLENGKTYATS